MDRIQLVSALTGGKGELNFSRKQKLCSGFGPKR